MMLNLDYDNYIELYEAIYFYNKMSPCFDGNIPLLINAKIHKMGITQSIYTAVMRILVVTEMLDFVDDRFVLTNATKAKHKHIIDNIIKDDKDMHYAVMLSKAINKSEFFFNSISEAEYKIYSRYNYQVTHNIGKVIAKHIKVSNKNVLELGGNSGGLGAALLEQSNNCSYTVVDTKIPCKIGNELNKNTGSKITFVENDVLKLTLPKNDYDLVIAMNLLHDFNDEKCLDILQSCVKYSSKTTKLYIIEDILTSEFEPADAVIHGLRLAVSCNGGRQRTISEWEGLFAIINYKLEKIVKIDNILTTLVMTAI